jgi:hypothetical protein
VTQSVLQLTEKPDQELLKKPTQASPTNLEGA